MSNEKPIKLDHDRILEEWTTDSTIDETRLQYELARTPMLHSKYLGYFMSAKMKLVTAEKKFNTFKWWKRKYFRGEMEKHELVERGWSQWNGLKPSNSELNDLFDADRDLNDLHEVVKYRQMVVQGLEYILKQIAQRDWSIKAMVEYTKYINGG